MLALRAIEQCPELSNREAARIYSVCHTTLIRRRKGQSARGDRIANSRKLTNLEESTIVQYIGNNSLIRT